MRGALFERPKTIDELAEWLRTTRQFLKSEVDAGLLRARHLNVRTTAFLASDVQRWLDKKASDARKKKETAPTEAVSK
jgi:hypothetical protein